MDTEKWKTELGSQTNFSEAPARSPSPTKIVSGPNSAKRGFPEIIATSSIRGQGMSELLAAIDRHRETLERTGEIEMRRAAIAERRLLAAGEGLLRDAFVRHRHGKLSPLLEQLRVRSLSPHAAAQQLLRELNIGGDA
ncbi:MAG TPA: hypothetical protein VF304_13575 [Casimicrobiaceae bacterium]